MQDRPSVTTWGTLLLFGIFGSLYWITQAAPPEAKYPAALILIGSFIVGLMIGRSSS